MAIPVLTAISDAEWEADLVAALESGDLGVTVVRRCVDLAELLSTAATGRARAVLVSADLRRLDRDALTRLATAGVAVVGFAPPGDPAAELWLRQLGVVHVLPSNADPLVISATVKQAVEEVDPRSRPDLADPRAALRAVTPSRPDEPSAPADDPGHLVAVWGPTGAPGRSTLAVALASELAALGCDTLLVDADVYGGVVGQLLGLLDESPGLAAACRLANNGALDADALADLAREVLPNLRVLTGISRADRWPELRPASVEAVLELAVRAIARVTVVDCGFGLEQDEELSYDTMAPRRNGATIAVLEQADVVLAVGSGDPVGLQRLVRGLAELRERVPEADPRIVVNRLRRSAVPGDAEQEIKAALLRYAGISDAHFVPLDMAGFDSAVAAGRTLTEVAPGSPARHAVRGLACALTGMPPDGGRRRRRRRVTA